MKKLISTLTIIFSFIFISHSQCACVWLDANGVKQCQLYSNCSGPNLSNCANKVTSGTLCPCQQWPGMNWNCGGCQTNGACWYNGTACDADMVCTYIALPVEMIKFTVENVDGENIIKWSTASEHNCSHYVLFYSCDGDKFTNMVSLPGQGNTSDVSEYHITHYDFLDKINYYKVIQVDYDGHKTEYGPISIDNRVKGDREIKRVDVLGREVDNSYVGIVYIYYDNGEVEKTLQMNE